MALLPGDDFDRYRIEKLLGQGGWGHVYRATDTRLRRKVALKVLKEQRLAEAPRFLREARAAAALAHPNIVQVFDLGEANGVPYIAMELVEGRSLAELAGRNAGPTVREKIGWLTDLAKGIHASHQAGLLHRDVKPHNVMVTTAGVAKMLDFGLAKPTEVPDVAGPATQPAFQTRAGHVVGTPRYMAPEALRGAVCDGRADQYSWGITAYEVLTGVHPRGGKADPIALDTPRLVSELVPEVPFPVAAAVARTLIGERTERFDDMGALIAALDRAMAREPEPPPTEQAPATADGGQPTRLEGSAATVREPTFNDLTDPSRPPVMTRRSDELYGVSEITKQSATPSGRRRTAPAGPEARQKALQKELQSTVLSPGVPTRPAGSDTTIKTIKTSASALKKQSDRRRWIYLVIGLVAAVGIALGVAAAYVARSNAQKPPAPFRSN